MWGTAVLWRLSEAAGTLSDQQTFTDELSERFDGLGVRQVEFPDNHIFISRVFQDVSPRLFGPLQVPARHHDTRSWDTRTDIVNKNEF